MSSRGTPVYRGEPTRSHVEGLFSLAALVGTPPLAGAIERRSRLFPSIGYDSLAVAVTCGAGVYLLYRLR